jgi:hypothetical protein
MRDSTVNGTFVLAAILFFVLLVPVVALADPCLVVYPNTPTVYYYDTSEYYTVTSGHPLYDPLYDRGGEVLLDINDNSIDFSIYQAPNLIGFQASTDGQDGYFISDLDFDLIVDGFSNSPTTFVDIILVFEWMPDTCTPTITVDGNLVSGGTYGIGDLVVATPTADGNNYSDTTTHHIMWFGCPTLRVYAFSDENGNGVRDGGECFTAFSHDLTVPTQESTWGQVKALYGE